LESDSVKSRFFWLYLRGVKRKVLTISLLFVFMFGSGNPAKVSRFNNFGNQLSLSYGVYSSREFGTGFNLMYNSRPLFTCTYRSHLHLYGGGFVANYNQDQAEVGLRGFVSPRLITPVFRINSHHISIPYISAQTNLAKEEVGKESFKGFNVRPGVGVMSFYKLNKRINIILNLNYGYSIFDRNEHFNDDHHFEVKLGLGVKIERTPERFKS
jgi:hypothetical protein